MEIKRLTPDEIKKIIDELKSNGKFYEYRDMMTDDFEEHKIVYKLSEDEMIATAHANDTIPYKLKEFYDWQQMNILIEEDEGI